MMNDVQGDAVLIALACASVPFVIAAVYWAWRLRWIFMDGLGRLSRMIPV